MMLLSVVDEPEEAVEEDLDEEEKKKAAKVVRTDWTIVHIYSHAGLWMYNA